MENKNILGKLSTEYPIFKVLNDLKNEKYKFSENECPEEITYEMLEEQLGGHDLDALKPYRPPDDNEWKHELWRSFYITMHFILQEPSKLKTIINLKKCKGSVCKSKSKSNKHIKRLTSHSTNRYSRRHGIPLISRRMVF